MTVAVQRDDGSWLTACCLCLQPCILTASAKSKGMYLCRGCRSLRSKQDYERRKSLGLQVSGPTSSPEHQKAYCALYLQKPEVKARRAAYSRQRRQSLAERHKHEARWKVNRALASGRLKPSPCHVCGAEKSEAHHDDYSRPLDVRWLCRVHHREHHMQARARGDAA